MSKYTVMGKVAKCGSVDSKYFNKYNKFDEDIQSKIKETEDFRIKLRNMICENPNYIEQKFNIAVNELLNIKKEFLSDKKKANTKWDSENKERVRYLQDRSKCKNFILKKATKEDLILIKKWIEEREKRVD